MKTICVLTYERTGSGWLSAAFDTPETISIHEVFSDDPLLWMMKCKQIFNKIYHIDDKILDFLTSIYHYNNFFIDTISYNKIKNNILNKSIYNEQTLDIFTDICKKHNKNLVFKIFPQHIKYLSDNFLDSIDYLILNYRQDLIASFYSLEKARVSGTWFSDQNSRANDNHKILWHEDRYKTYVNNLLYNISILKTKYDIFNKPKFIVSYEELHQDAKNISYKDKTHYLKNKMKQSGMNLLLNHNEYFFKQNNTIVFDNMSDFTNSINLSNIQKTLCIN